MRVFLTGGTGYIGRHLLLLLASRHEITALVRNKTSLQPFIDQLPADQQSNIVPVIGDLTQPRLGLDEDGYKQVLTADLIIHAGGPMNIALSLREAEQSFLVPARSLVQLAADIHTAHRLQHFIHVVGYMSPYDESNALAELDHLLDHKPPYERMKFLADSYIRKSLRAMGIPLSTVNPSVVVGDSFSGKTEQLGGLSILIDAVRRGLMPLVPSGGDYWLPMVHVDHVASFMASLANTQVRSSNTYYLLDPKSASPSIQALIQLLAAELQAAPPRGRVPLPLLRSLLRLGAGNLLGIPAASMDFLVKSDFPIASRQHIERISESNYAIVPSTLPYIITDLDYRLSHADGKRQTGVVQRRRADLITLEHNASGTPIIFLHGTFSGADHLLPIADYLDDLNIWFVDLPGFGRTPYHHESSIIDGYVTSVEAMIAELNRPVIIVGHSFGGLVGARVMQRCPSLIQRLILLQPVLHPVERKYRMEGLTRRILKHMTPSKLKRTLLDSRSFMEAGPALDEYSQYVVNDLKSPRIRTTNAAVMAALTRPQSIQLNPETWDMNKVSLLWGDKDPAYTIPAPYEHLDITRIPYGHQFPIEFPERSAQWIRQVLKT